MRFLKKLHEVEPYNGFCAWASCSIFCFRVPQAKPWGQEDAWLMFKDVGRHCQNISNTDPDQNHGSLHLSWSCQKAAACEISWYKLLQCSCLLRLAVSFGLICKDKSLQNLETSEVSIEAFPKIWSECLGIPKRLVLHDQDWFWILSQPGFATSFRWLRKEACIFTVL